jgi:hypothetical protein
VGEVISKQNSFMPKQRLHFAPHGFVAGADAIQERGPVAGNFIQRSLEQLRVLIAGGGSFSTDEVFSGVSTGELFDLYTETFRLTGSMASLHDTATLLGNGSVLFTGGDTTAAELYVPPLLTFDGGRVRPGDSFNATFSGTSLNNATYYDLLFHAPGDSTDQVALNWQRGLTATHTVPTGTATGTWTITGVRPHEKLDDHAAPFLPVSVELLVNQ